MPRITLYNALNGLSCLVDAGTGLRAKSWLEDLPMWLKESVEPTTLAGIGLGRLANYPSIVDGSKMSVRPMGEALQTPNFLGVEIFECVPNTQIVGIGNTASTAVPGVAALTVGAISNPLYGTNGAASGTVCTPINGAGYPAFITTDAVGGGWNLAATDGVLTVRINGQPFTAAVGVGAATTVANVMDAIDLANWPCRIAGVINGGAITQIRLQALAAGGGSTTMQATVTAGTAGAVLFAAETGVIRYGWGSPLNDMRRALALNDAQVPGVLAPHRVLPGSITVSATLAGATADSMTDNRLGAMSNLAGTSLGLVAYATGRMSCIWAANVAAAAVTARFKALWPVNLYKPARVNEHNGAEFAIRLLP